MHVLAALVVAGSSKMAGTASEEYDGNNAAEPHIEAAMLN
jgi:hypothetical protein